MEVHMLDSPPPTYVGSAVSPLTDFWDCCEVHQPAGKAGILDLFKCLKRQTRASVLFFPIGGVYRGDCQAELHWVGRSSQAS